jgi:hypothetical protein
MIKHMVMSNVRVDSSEEKAQAIAQIQRSFESLHGQIPAGDRSRHPPNRRRMPSPRLELLEQHP